MHKTIHIVQGNTKYNPETPTHNLFFDKHTKVIQQRQDSLFNKLSWNNWTFTYLTPYTKFNLDFILMYTFFNYKTFRSVQEKHLYDLNLGRVL